MIRYWGQVAYRPPEGEMAGYELFLREQRPGSHRWQVPHDFSRFSAKMMCDLLVETLPTLPAAIQLVSLNLDQAQFIQSEYCRLFAALNRKVPFQLAVELTERIGHGRVRVAVDELVKAATAFKAAGVSVCLDDVGTGENQSELVSKLDPFVDEYKYALQNVRGKVADTVIRAELASWQRRASAQHKLFALEGFETPEDIALIETYRPDLVQGYYYGKPSALPIGEDFHL